MKQAISQRSKRTQNKYAAHYMSIQMKYSEPKVPKLTPKQSDRILNYMEVTTLYNTNKLTIDECRWYYCILNTFIWNK